MLLDTCKRFIIYNYQIIWKLCIRHGSMDPVLCAEYQNNSSTDINGYLRTQNKSGFLRPNAINHVYVNMCACAYIYTGVYCISILVYTNAHAWKCLCAFIYVGVCICAYIYMYPYIMNMFMRTHVNVYGRWNTLGVPLPEKKAIPHGIAEKTQRKLKYTCMDKYLLDNY